MPRPKGKRPSVRLTISIDPADHAQLTRLSEEHDLSIAWMIRKAIGEFVERNANGDQQELPLPRANQNGEAA